MILNVPQQALIPVSLGDFGIIVELVYKGLTSAKKQNIAPNYTIVTEHFGKYDKE